MNDKILQIIPAIGWSVELEEEGKNLRKYPLACWALVEMDDGSKVVMGMTSDQGGGGLEFCQDKQFRRYVHIG